MFSAQSSLHKLYLLWLSTQQIELKLTHFGQSSGIPFDEKCWKWLTLFRQNVILLKLYSFIHDSHSIVAVEWKFTSKLCHKLYEPWWPNAAILEMLYVPFNNMRTHTDHHNIVGLSSQLECLRPVSQYLVISHNNSEVSTTVLQKPANIHLKLTNH